MIGGDKTNPKVVVAANGGSDLIYLPDGDRELAKRVIDALLAQDYVSGIFVDTKLGTFPGTLTLDDIALEGAAITPHPAIAISFRSFDTVCGEPVRCTVEVADTILQEGQGMHGSFSRADTWNFMAMQGPDFKARFVDPAPASNADVGRTIAQVLGLDVSDKGKLDRPGFVGSVTQRRAAEGRQPRADLRAGGERAHHRAQHADGGRCPLFRCGRVSGTHSRIVGNAVAGRFEVRCVIFK